MKVVRVCHSCSFYDHLSLTIVQELYLRDFMSCNSDACDSCITGGGEKITLSSTPYNHQYLIPDAEVLINQIDLLQQDIPPFCDVIILQSVLLEVRSRNISIFNRLGSLLRNSSKRFVFFANQNFETTYRIIRIHSIMNSGPTNG